MISEAARATASPTSTAAVFAPPSAVGGATQQPVELGVAWRHAVEEAVETTRLGTQIDAGLGRVEGRQQPGQSDQTVERWRCVDPAPGQARRQAYPVLR